MTRARDYVLLIIGIAIGIGMTFIFSSKQKPTTPLNNSTPPVVNESLEQTCTSKPDAPPCPCLFSDKILDPPEFSPSLKEVLETNLEGEVLIRWLERPGAKRYEVYVEDEKSQLIKTYKASRTVIYLKDIPLPPGKFDAHYVIRLASINGKEEAGPKGKPRSLYVKPQASVVAPQVQEIRVED